LKQHTKRKHVDMYNEVEELDKKIEQSPNSLQFEQGKPSPSGGGIKMLFQVEQLQLQST